MIPWLVKNQGITHQEVADHFQISVEQMLQDVMTLTVTGIGQFPDEQFDVDYTNGRIFVRDQLGLDRPFRFDSTEAACLLLGLESLANLPSELSGFDRNEIDAVKERISKAIPISSGVNVIAEELQEGEIFEKIALAINQGNQVSFDYWNNARDDVVRRTVSPLRIYTVNQTSIVDAFEHGRGWRSFRLANVDTVCIESDKIDFESKSFEPMKTFEVEIQLPMKSVHLLENFVVVKRKNINEHLVKAVIKIAEPIWLARQVLASGCTIEVLKPDDIGSQVDNFVKTAQSAYPRSGKGK